MAKKKPAPYRHQDWPAWRYAPDGSDRGVFKGPDEVPEGWTDVNPDYFEVEPPKKPGRNTRKKKGAEPAESGDSFDRDVIIPFLREEGYIVPDDISDEELKEAHEAHLARAS